MIGSPQSRGPEVATLLDVLIDGFEKNEVFDGWHRRALPLPDEATAVQRFSAFVEEARRWLGEPEKTEDTSGRRRAAWTALEIRQADRGILVLVKMSSRFDWWADEHVWHGDPLAAVFNWIAGTPLRR